VATLLLLSVAFSALDNAALIFLVRRSFHAPEPAYGWVVAVYAVGMVTAPLLLATLALRVSARSVLLTGVGIFGTGTLATGLSPGLGVGLAAQAVAGAGNGLENAGTDTLLQQSTPESDLGAVFGTVYTRRATT
jgi:predicted MFS family arabinose efflux permease